MAVAEPADRLAAFLLLISPFFFWGTSMVAMKVGCWAPTACILGRLRS